MGEATYLSEHEVVQIEANEEPRFGSLMDVRYYLGAAPKIGETLGYTGYGPEFMTILWRFAVGVIKNVVRCRMEKGGRPGK